MKTNDFKKIAENLNPTFFTTMKTKKSECLLQGIKVYSDGLYETVKEKFKVSYNDGSWIKFYERCKGGKMLIVSDIKDNYRNILRCYCYFLRLIGVENKDEMMYYILHYTTYSIKFNKILNITYEKTEKLIEEVIDEVNKTTIDVIKEKSNFKDDREIFIPDEIIVNGVVKKLNKSEKTKIAREHFGRKTDDKISKLYNPDLTDKENCLIIGVKIRRLQQWKKEQRDNGLSESIEDKIKRLYNPELTDKENCLNIGCSRNTLKKYKVIEPIEEIEPINKSNEIAEDDGSWIDDLLTKEF